MRQCNWLVHFLAFGLFLISSGAHAERIPINEAIDHLVRQFGRDIDELSAKTKKSSIVALTTSENLPPEVKQYLLKRMEGSYSEAGEFRFVQCRDCFTVRAETDGNDIVVKKGVTDKKELSKVASFLGVRSYTEVHLEYGASKVQIQVNVYNVSDSKLLWAKSYKTRLLNLGRTSMHFSLTAEQIVGLEKSGAPIGLTLYGAERIYGFGTVGLYLFGSFQNKEVKSYVSLGPRVALDLNQILFSAWSWGSLHLDLGLGYGFYSGDRDVSLSTGLKLETGRYFHFRTGFVSGVFFTGDGNFMPSSLTFGVGVNLG